MKTYLKTMGLVGLLTFAQGTSLFAQDLTSASSAPPSAAPPGIGKQIGGGALLGLGGMAGGGAVGAGLFAATCFLTTDDCGFAWLIGAGVGGALGFGSGFPLGVHYFGSNESHTGSLGWTFGGAAIGSIVGFGATFLMTGIENESGMDAGDEDVLFASSLAGIGGAALGALIGFNLTRGPRQGIPQVSVAPLPNQGWVAKLQWSL